MDTQVDYSVVLSNLTDTIARSALDAAVAKAESAALRQQIEELNARIKELTSDASEPSE